MTDVITLTEPLVDTLIPTWTGLDLWKAPSQAGPYARLVQIPYVSGQTTYTYSDPSGLSTDWFEVRRYGPGPTYSGFSTTWTVSAPATARRSLVTQRRLLAERLGGYTLVRTDATAPDASSIVASDLAGGLDPDAYRQAWVYPTQTGSADPAVSAYRLRRVGTQSLNTSSGLLSVTVAWPTPIAGGVDVELHTLLPPVRHDKFPGLRECLNAALAELWTYARLSMPGVNGQPSYDLSTANDWLDPGAINELYGPPLDSTLNAAPWPGYAVLQNAESVKLGVSPTFGTGDAATVGVFRPGDTWIRTGGVWGSASYGLQNDSDESLFQPEILVMVALTHAYHALSTQGEASERTYYANLEQRQRAKVNRWKLIGLTRSDHGMSHGLPTGAGFDPKDFSTW
jgi:hypothetical protein